MPAQSDLFTGENSDQFNALYAAFVRAAMDYERQFPDSARSIDQKQAVYNYLEQTPLTSLVVEVVTALNTAGKRVT